MPVSWGQGIKCVALSRACTMDHHFLKSPCVASHGLNGREGKQTSPSTSVLPLSLDMGSRPALNYHSQPVMRLSAVVLHPSSLRGFNPQLNRQLCLQQPGSSQNSLSFQFFFIPFESLGSRSVVPDLTAWLWWSSALRPPGQDWTPADPCPKSLWAGSRMQRRPADSSCSTSIGSNSLTPWASPTTKTQKLRS